jgi:exosortase/archaeosortase family protein
LKEEEYKEGTFGRLTYQRLLIISAITFLLLPFITTFNEFLTAIVENTPLYTLIQRMIVPNLVKMIGAVLQYFFGITTSVSSANLFLQGEGHAVNIYISWNCIGWQSLILFVFTLITGLQGPYTLKSKTYCLILGLEGTFLVNLGRIVLVILVAFYWGHLPAVIIHDYGGTIIILVWLALFWFFSFNYVLKRIQKNQDNQLEQKKPE